MPSYPTDLSAEEEKLAQARLRELAEEFTADGILRTPAWREVFLRTWRHPYVPSYYPELDAPCLLCIDPQKRGEWLEAVYSNQTLITKVAQVPLSRALRPGAGLMYTSSSTLPSLMLEELDVTDECRVLEIGTGSGYTPTLAATDGVAGYPPGAPYDRIIATCAVPAIPATWLEQAAPGAVILNDVHGPLGGTLARLTANTHGTATGRFVPHWAGFMWMRHTVEPPAPQHTWTDDESVESVTDVDPALLQTHGLFGFVAQWHLPDVSWGRVADDDGQPALCLAAPDVVSASRTNGGYKLNQAGPRRLWDRIEQAHHFWQDAGQPSYERFGITATSTEQYVWYDHPSSHHRWPLPAPTLPSRPNRSPSDP